MPLLSLFTRLDVEGSCGCFARRHGNRDILTTLHVKSSELCLAGRLVLKQDDSPKHYLKMTITTLDQSPIVAPSSGVVGPCALGGGRGGWGICAKADAADPPHSRFLAGVGRHKY